MKNDENTSKKKRYSVNLLLEKLQRDTLTGYTKVRRLNNLAEQTYESVYEKIRSKLNDLYEFLESRIKPK